MDLLKLTRPAIATASWKTFLEVIRDLEPWNTAAQYSPQLWQWNDEEIEGFAAKGVQLNLYQLGVN